MDRLSVESELETREMALYIIQGKILERFRMTEMR